MATQLKLALPRWGGRRKNAGRPRRDGRKLPPGVPHLRRPALEPRHPAHVTLKVLKELPSLRSPGGALAVIGALQAGSARKGFRVVHFSVLRDHIHLVVEATDAQALTRGVQCLSIRVARQINRALGRRGKVFADRYHARALRTPTEVRRAIAYVVHNFAKHEVRAGRGQPAGFLDLLSSQGIPLREPRTWLLRIGWKRGRS